MYLKYVQLDLPYRENTENINNIMNQFNCSYEEARVMDYDNNWMIPIRRQFELETRCMASMFLRLLGKYKTKDCSKIVIDCVEKSTRTNYSCCMGICLVHYELNYEEFFAKNEYEKKLIIFQIIRESVLNIAKVKEWDITPLEDAFYKIKKLNYNNFWTFGKKVKSPNKLHTAELYIEHKMKSIDFFAIIRNNQDEIVDKKLIIKESPSEWVFTQYLGKLSWATDTEIHLKDKTGVNLFTIAL